MEFQADLSKARVRLKALVHLVQETGESVFLMERGEAVARLAPIEDCSLPAGDPPTVAWHHPDECENPEMALRHLFPLRVVDERMVGTYPFGDHEVEFPIRFVLCPRCEGRGRTLRRDLEGALVPEEQAGTFEDGHPWYHALDACDVCQGRRVIPRIHVEGVFSSYLREIGSRARFLDRVERELWPLLHRRNHQRTGAWIDFDVPF